MASVKLVFRGGTELKKLHPYVLEYVPPERIKTITIFNDIVYVSDNCKWSYKFVMVDGKWDLDRIKMKRRYGRYGIYKTSKSKRKNRFRY